MTHWLSRNGQVASNANVANESVLSEFERHLENFQVQADLFYRSDGVVDSAMTFFAGNPREQWVKHVKLTDELVRAIVVYLQAGYDDKFITDGDIKARLARLRDQQAALARATFPLDKTSRAQYQQLLEEHVDGAATILVAVEDLVVERKADVSIDALPSLLEDAYLKRAPNVLPYPYDDVSSAVRTWYAQADEIADFWHVRLSGVTRIVLKEALYTHLLQTLRYSLQYVNGLEEEARKTVQETKDHMASISDFLEEKKIKK